MHVNAFYRACDCAYLCVPFVALPKEKNKAIKIL